ncbi:MAG: 50S ribosomal protein L32e [Candidatus Woesearchaeota archaeon]
MEKLLELRKEKKKRKPDFVRQQGKSVKKLEEKWRQPKGMHSKLRRKNKGHPKHPSMGYSSPRLVRGLNSAGMKELVVNNIEDLSSIAQNMCVVIAAGVGKRRRVAILRKALEMNLNVSNIKDPSAFIAQAEESLKNRKEEAKTREDKKKKSKEEALKKAEKKKEEKKEEKTEEKEKKEKEEQRKVLEKKD